MKVKNKSNKWRRWISILIDYCLMSLSRIVHSYEDMFCVIAHDLQNPPHWLIFHIRDVTVNIINYFRHSDILKPKNYYLTTRKHEIYFRIRCSVLYNRWLWQLMMWILHLFMCSLFAPSPSLNIAKARVSGCAVVEVRGFSTFHTVTVQIQYCLWI